MSKFKEGDRVAVPKYNIAATVKAFIPGIASLCNIQFYVLEDLKNGTISIHPEKELELYKDSSVNVEREEIAKAIKEIDSIIETLNIQQTLLASMINVQIKKDDDSDDTFTYSLFYSILTNIIEQLLIRKYNNMNYAANPGKLDTDKEWIATLRWLIKTQKEYQKFYNKMEEELQYMYNDGIKLYIDSPFSLQVDIQKILPARCPWSFNALLNDNIDHLVNRLPHYREMKEGE